MSVDFDNLRERARPWLDPIPGASPAGAAIKLDPAYQSLVSEVAKVVGETDWKGVASACGDLLRTRTKDLVVGTYLAHALHVTNGIDGLTTGVTFLAEMMDRFWDTMHPEARRLRGRANALQWFVERTAQRLARPLDGIPVAQVDALESATQELARIVRRRFADSAPGMSSVLDEIAKIRISLAEAAPKVSPVTPVEPGAALAPPVAPLAGTAPQATPSPSAPTSSPAIQPFAVSPLSTAGADATDFLRGAGDALIAAAGLLRRTEATDPASYRILRVGLWLHLSSAPAATGPVTQVPPIPPPRRAALDLLAGNRKWVELLDETESSAPEFRFALDLHRMSWQALSGLGAPYDAARLAVAAEMRSLLARMPQLPRLSFSDGSAFADPQTRLWIESEIAPPQAAAAPARPEGSEGDGFAARVVEAKKLISSARTKEALSQLQEGIGLARAGRERFVARLALARLAGEAGLTAVAKATYEDLQGEAALHALDRWEPALVAECLKGLIVSARSLSNDPRGASHDLAVTYTRLCGLDPAAAHEAWP